MKYRELGATGIKVSEVGFGSWGLGGDAYGSIDERDAREVVSAAYESGINYFDTSDGYGGGRSEELIGSVLNSVRSKVVIATKGGTLPHDGFEMPQDFSPRYLRKALEGSLARLKTEYVDLYQLALPTIQDLENNEAIFEALRAFQKEGKTRLIGLAARSPQDALVAIQKFEFHVIQINFNLIDQRALEIGLFQAANERNVGVAVRTPLAFGYLAGNLTGNEKFGTNDQRAKWPQAQLKLWAGAAALFSSMVEYGIRSHAQLALQFCLAEPIVSTVMPDMMCVREVEENARASTLPVLTERDMAQIRLIYESNTFYHPNAKRSASAT